MTSVPGKAKNKLGMVANNSLFHLFSFSYWEADLGKKLDAMMLVTSNFVEQVSSLRPMTGFATSLWLLTGFRTS